MRENRLRQSDDFSVNLVLTGLMGTGKTTLGRLVASRLGRQFVDTDELVEAQFGPAKDILNRADGEHQFRQFEKVIAHELSLRTNLVISTGGRFMLEQSNIDLMMSTGVVLCLEADLAEIVQRLLSSTTTTYRPRFDSAVNKLELMKKLKQMSKPYFSQFEKLDSTGLTPEAAAGWITDWFLRKAV